MDFVDRVLVLHQHVPLNRFSLKCVDIVHPAIVIGWLLKVLEHAMLDLDLYISSVQGYPLPSEMFVSETLVRLKLEVRDVLTIDEALEELVLDNVFEFTREARIDLRVPPDQTSVPEEMDMILTYRRKQIPVFNNLVHLTIMTFVDISWESLPALVKNCPKLKTPVFEGFHLQHNTCPWWDTSTFLSSNSVTVLKILDLGGGAVGGEYSDEQIKQIQLILERMPNLKQLTIYYLTFNEEDVYELLAQLQGHPRVASSKCKIQVIHKIPFALFDPEILIRLPDKSIAGLIKELKESAATKFKTFQIPADWMLETITVVDSQVPVGRAQESRRRRGQFALHELEIHGGDQQPRPVEHDSGGVHRLRQGLRVGSCFNFSSVQTVAPFRILMSKSLVRLRESGTDEFTIIDVGEVSLSLPKLKTLHMNDVGFADESGAAFAKLVSSCHALEELAMDKIMWDFRGSCSDSNSSLKRVTIYSENIDDEDPKECVSFSTPNLISLEFSDIVAVKYGFKETNKCWDGDGDRCKCNPWEGTPIWLSSSPVKKLKVLRFGEICSHFSDMDKQMDLIKYFVETMPNLEEVMLYYDSPTDGDLEIVSRGFQKLEKVASTKCKIQVIFDEISFSSTVYSTSSTVGLVFFKNTFLVEDKIS
ncbi:hypothetical protein F2Q70_00041129 [Brassica cretica]|uniref:FBD domain-containing protein n=1 Tax=Brassica cretica TaxID=69181 RepID=A0A8S9K141_BRACR|nr:hypothetical protein F2Q70_00041129 [Brassica cretica]